MELAWENPAPENCLKRNRRNFWFLVKCRVKHTVGHLKATVTFSGLSGAC